MLYKYFNYIPDINLFITLVSISWLLDLLVIIVDEGLEILESTSCPRVGRQTFISLSRMFAVMVFAQKGVGCLVGDKRYSDVGALYLYDIYVTQFTMRVRIRRLFHILLDLCSLTSNRYNTAELVYIVYSLVYPDFHFCAFSTNTRECLNETRLQKAIHDD